MGATVLDDAVIGEGAIVAAGALVLKNTQIGDGELWGGVPAKFIKKVDPKQAKELNQNIAQHYIMYKDWYGGGATIENWKLIIIAYAMILDISRYVVFYG